MVGEARLDRIFTWKNEEIKKGVSTAFLPRKSEASTWLVASLWRNMPIFAFKKHFARKNTRKNDRNFIRKNTGSWTRARFTSPRGHFIEIPSNKGLTPETLPPAGQVQVRCRSGAGQVQVRCRSGAGQVRSGAGQVQVRCQVRPGQVHCESGQVRCIASQVHWHVIGFDISSCLWPTPLPCLRKRSPQNIDQKYY